MLGEVLDLAVAYNLMTRKDIIMKCKRVINEWYSDYQCLNLCNGDINFIMEDNEDMIEITYKDGMLIDIGKPELFDYYCITVVSSNDDIGWSNPIEEIIVEDKQDLVRNIQEIILKYRK